MMKLLYKGKDGGQDSTVTGYWLIEWKRLFSVALLKFEDGSRDAYHNHAFNSVSWVLKGKLIEDVLCWKWNTYRPSLKPIFTFRGTFHKVTSIGTTWVLSFRGPWRETWDEYLPEERRFRTLANGRVEVAEG